MPADLADSSQNGVIAYGIALWERLVYLLQQPYDKFIFDSGLFSVDKFKNRRKPARKGVGESAACNSAPQ